MRARIVRVVDWIGDDQHRASRSLSALLSDGANHGRGGRVDNLVRLYQIAERRKVTAVSSLEQHFKRNVVEGPIGNYQQTLLANHSCRRLERHFVQRVGGRDKR